MCQASERHVTQVLLVGSGGQRQGSRTAALQIWAQLRGNPEPRSSLSPPLKEV